MGQLTPHVSQGYGFAAIIVAFVGRLDPLGAILAALVLATFSIGGELAQSRARPALRHHRGVPGRAAALAAGLRHAHPVPSTLGAPVNEIALLVAATLAAGTPLALAGLGLLVNERAGVVNLGAEGMMAIAAVTGFAAAFHTGSEWLGFAAGAAAGAAAASVFGWLALWLYTNQYATGLAL